MELAVGDGPACDRTHDAASLTLQTFLLVGIIVAYVPQHFRIIAKGSSEGFSPWFLLLGATSASSGLINVITLQWQSIKCCSEVGAMLCYENLGGVEIVGTQWIAFTLILVLFLVYFPPHLKYTEYQATAHPGHAKTCECDPCAASRAGPVRSTTPEWKLAITLAWVVLIHFSFSIFITGILLSGQQNPDGTPSDRVYAWATFLGLVSTSLAFIQYAPQLRHTYRSKLVGAISIPAMSIQSPGAVLMVYTIAIKPGTNWTSWMVYAAAGLLQGSLLIMCLFWKARQKRLHIDDFGNPLPDPEDGRQTDSDSRSGLSHEGPLHLDQDGTNELPANEREVVREEVTEALETTPLLRGNSESGKPQESGKGKKWSDILRWR